MKLGRLTQVSKLIIIKKDIIQLTVKFSLVHICFQVKNESIQKPKSSSENEHSEDEDEGIWGRKSNISLLDQHTELKKMAEGIFFLILIYFIRCTDLIITYILNLIQCNS